MLRIIEFFAQLASDHNYWGIVLVLSGPILLVVCSLIEQIVGSKREKRKSEKGQTKL